MISYRDMTFCKGDGCTAFEGCPRALTKEVKAAADKWWGQPGAPIGLFMEPKKLSCYNKGLVPQKPDLMVAARKLVVNGTCVSLSEAKRFHTLEQARKVRAIKK